MGGKASTQFSLDNNSGGGGGGGISNDNKTSSSTFSHSGKATTTDLGKSPRHRSRTSAHGHHGQASPGARTDSDTPAAPGEVISPVQIRQKQLQELREARPSLSEKQSELVTTTWAVIQQQMADVGTGLFDRMFQNYPDVKGAFDSLRSVDSADKHYADEIRAHGVRVLGTLELVITHRDDPEFVINHLHELGHKHITFNAKVEYMDLISQMFLFAVEPVLGDDHWTPDVEQAWAQLFRFIIHLMKESMML